jgi:hypothetical protein
VTKISEVETMLAVTSNRRTLQRNVGSFKSHAANIKEDGNLQSHRRENRKSYIALTGWAV